MTLRVLESKQTDMEVSTMAQLSAIQGMQFGREVYSSVIKFKDLERFMHVFPKVQRALNMKKVGSIKRYIISGLESTGHMNMRFIPAITATSRSTIFYDQTTHRIAIDTERSKLSINDGQHRFTAINQTLEYLEKEFVKSKDKMRTARIKDMIDTIKDMVIPVTIFANLTEREEKQLFYDLNSLAARPSKNANIRLNQLDLYARMARELAQENKYLRHYGVEMDKTSIQSANKNTLLLATVHKMIKELLGDEISHDRDFLNEGNYKEFKKYINETFDRLFFTLPNDLNVRGKYLTDKSYTLKSIARFINHARNYLDLRLSDDEIFKIIGDMDWTMTTDFWSKYGASPGLKKGNIVFNGGGHGAAKSVYDALIDQATT